MEPVDGGVMVPRHAKGALALGMGLWGFSGEAVAQAACASEECACEEALSRNTAEALEDFMTKYPQSESNGRTACAALAITPAEEPIQPDKRDREDGTIGEPGAAVPPEE
jgi:hypothetical protein